MTPLNEEARTECVDMILEVMGYPRDELFEYPNRADASRRYIQTAERTLDKILALSAVPADTVNSVEELDALPIGTVVIINGTMLQADDRDDYGTMWSRVRDIDAYPSEALALPARVLYRPEVNDA